RVPAGGDPGGGGDGGGGPAAADSPRVDRDRAGGAAAVLGGGVGLGVDLRQGVVSSESPPVATGGLGAVVHHMSDPVVMSPLFAELSLRGWFPGWLALLLGLAAVAA